MTFSFGTNLPAASSSSGPPAVEVRGGVLSSQAAQSVNKALEQFVKPEQLDGENSYKCSKYGGRCLGVEGPFDACATWGDTACLSPGPGRSVCMCTLQMGGRRLTAGGGQGGQREACLGLQRCCPWRRGLSASSGPRAELATDLLSGARWGAATSPRPVKALPLYGSYLALGIIDARNLQF